MKLTKTCAKFLRKHGGTILAIGASIGVGLTMWETGKATVKATTLVTMNKDEPMTKKEIVKDCWKFYIPAAVVGAGTVACILGSNALNKKQLASMTAAYMALGKTYQEYRREVAERIGAEEEKKLRIKDVIFAPPATIIYWSDGSKTVVKCSEKDVFDPEKGLAMAIAKRCGGNKGNYYKEIQNWVEKSGKKYPGKTATQKKAAPKSNPDRESMKKWIFKANEDWN